MHQSEYGTLLTTRILFGLVSTNPLHSSHITLIHIAPTTPPYCLVFKCPKLFLVICIFLSLCTCYSTCLHSFHVAGWFHPFALIICSIVTSSQSLITLFIAVPHKSLPYSLSYHHVCVSHCINPLSKYLYLNCLFTVSFFAM